MFDEQRLSELRENARINNIDLTRAKITTADGTFVVLLDRPKVDVGSFLGDEPPRRIEARTAARAEGELLIWLIRIQRAERRIVRTGSCHWHPDQICRQPLSDTELTAHKDGIAHAAKIKKLQEELVEAIANAERVSTTQAQAKALAERYGMSAVPTPRPSSKRQERAQ